MTWEKEAVEDVMRKFDFHKVKKVMDALNWGYPYGQAVPEIDKLRQLALEYLTDAIELADDPEYKDEMEFTCRTGGFEVGYKRRGQIRLSFIITDAFHSEPGFYR